MARPGLSRRAALAALTAGSLARPEAARAAPDGSLGRIIDAGVVRLGVLIEGTTLAGVSPDGAFQGYLAELGSQIAAGFGVRPEFLRVPRGELLSWVAAGRCDIGLGGAIADMPTALRVHLSDPIMHFSLVALAPAAVDIIGPQDLRGLRVAVLDGPSILAAALGAGVPRDRIANFPTWEQVAAALESGACQVAILPDYHAAEIRRQTPRMTQHFSLGDFWHCCEVRMGQHDLLRALNTLIYMLRQEGDLQDLHRAYFGHPLPALRVL